MALKQSFGSFFSYDAPYWGRTNGFAVWKAGRLQFTDTWNLLSQGNPRDSNGRYLSGGPFHLEKITNHVSPVHLAKNGNTYPNGTYTGPIVAGFATGHVQTGMQDEPTGAEIASDGSIAISRVHPAAPEYSLAQQLGELRERFPTMIGSTVMRDKVHIARSAGSEYLNVEFGWRPLVKAVVDFAHTVKDANSIIGSQVRKNREFTRRRYNFPQVTDFAMYDVGGGFYPTAANVTGSGQLYERTVHDKWFEGAFVYWTPLSDSARGKLLLYEQRANKLLGTRITPEVLWELTPWSWAVDWYTNAGEILSNLSYIGDDASVMKWGYMMNHQVSYWQLYLQRTNAGKLISSTRGVVSERKMRTPSSPYGFNVGWADLTPRQTAIAVAAGATRT